jgi:hypothetical protein
VRRSDCGIYSSNDLTEDVGWAEDREAEELGDVLRSAMREEYAEASVEEMGDALADVLDSMSPAEAFNFSSALNQIGKSASRLTSDPTFIQIARTAAPIAGGALGTVIGGPVGTALGSKLGNVAASALLARAAPPPAAARPVAAAPAPSPAAPPPVIPAPAAAPPVAAAPVPGVAPAPPSEIPLAPGPASSVAGGSAAAAQGLVLTQQPDVLRSLLATALGQHGRQQVSGLPAAQVLGMLSQVLGQAAADADELMYLGQQADAAESVLEDAPTGPVRSLYTDLVGADNLELAEAAGWDGLDR